MEANAALLLCALSWFDVVSANVSPMPLRLRIFNQLFTFLVSCGEAESERECVCVFGRKRV